MLQSPLKLFELANHKSVWPALSFSSLIKALAHSSHLSASSPAPLVSMQPLML